MAFCYHPGLKGWAVSSITLNQTKSNCKEKETQVKCEIESFNRFQNPLT